MKLRSEPHSNTRIRHNTEQDISKSSTPTVTLLTYCNKKRGCVIDCLVSGLTSETIKSGD